MTDQRNTCGRSQHTLNDVQGGGGFSPLEYSPPVPGADGAQTNGIVTSRSPWWIDYNHAPATADGRGGVNSLSLSLFHHH